jgi:hypothetical protein
MEVPEEAAPIPEAIHEQASLPEPPPPHSPVDEAVSAGASSPQPDPGEDQADLMPDLRLLSLAPAGADVHPAPGQIPNCCERFYLTYFRPVLFP